MADADLERALARIVDAWTVEGPVPGYHRAMVGQVRRRWPVLAQALDDAARLRRATITDRRHGW